MNLPSYEILYTVHVVLVLQFLYLRGTNSSVTICKEYVMIFYMSVGSL